MKKYNEVEAQTQNAATLTTTIRDFMIQQIALNASWMKSGEEFKNSYDKRKKRVEKYDDDKLQRVYKRDFYASDIQDFAWYHNAEAIQKTIDIEYGSDAEFRKQKMLDAQYPDVLWCMPGGAFKVRAITGEHIRVNRK